MTTQDKETLELVLNRLRTRADVGVLADLETLEPVACSIRLASPIKDRSGYETLGALVCAGCGPAEDWEVHSIEWMTRDDVDAYNRGQFEHQHDTEDAICERCGESLGDGPPEPDEDEAERTYFVRLSVMVTLTGAQQDHTPAVIYENVLDRLQAGDRHDMDEVQDVTLGERMTAQAARDEAARDARRAHGPTLGDQIETERRQAEGRRPRCPACHDVLTDRTVDADGQPTYCDTCDREG